MGYITYESHVWNRTEATCTKSKSCKLCGYVDEESLGHNYANRC